MSKKEQQEPSFEENLAKLSKSVQELERADITLGEGIKVFEEGVKTAAQCLLALEQSKGKITQIKGELDRLFEEDYDI